MEVKSGVQCRYCGAELYEAEFVRKSGWPLRKDPPSVHFCNEDCRSNFKVHGKRNKRRGRRTTDIETWSKGKAKLMTATKPKLVDEFEADQFLTTSGYPSKKEDAEAKVKEEAEAEVTADLLEQDLTEDRFEDDTI